MRGRRVNRRGYLIDRFGNVLNTSGHVIYRALELDEDDEIPAPIIPIKQHPEDLLSDRSPSNSHEDPIHDES